MLRLDKTTHFIIFNPRQAKLQLLATKIYYQIKIHETQAQVYIEIDIYICKRTAQKADAETNPAANADTESRSEFTQIL